ncbi:MAG: hypothetical protein JXB40_04330 [Candidatus Omnitrophica bacterium]|nr:hypothetical protein [Candidatus Omnitrophota bacterium]
MLKNPIKELISAGIMFLALAFFSAYAFADGLPNYPLLEQAKRENPSRVDYALQNGARIELTDDGKSFYILWYPESANPADPPPLIATIHGHASWAFDEFYLWHKAAKERGYGILAIQWWLGQGERYEDYLTPQDIYRIIDTVSKRERRKPHTILFHGFSRGSANSYAVAAMDNQTGNNYFALIVANSGKPGLDFPPNREIMDGLYGPEPLRGTHWVTFAGGKDPHPDRDGIEGMRQAADFINRYGGVVDYAIEDGSAGHGGFHQSMRNMETALHIFGTRMGGE